MGRPPNDDPFDLKLDTFALQSGRK